MSFNLFICSGCGGVVPDDCLKCPDRGKGKGATVQRIMDDLRACTKNAEVTGCRDHYSRHMATLRRSRTKGARTMAILIENLVAYRRWCIEADMGRIYDEQ